MAVKKRKKKLKDKARSKKKRALSFKRKKKSRKPHSKKITSKRKNKKRLSSKIKKTKKKSSNKQVHLQDEALQFLKTKGLPETTSEQRKKGREVNVNDSKEIDASIDQTSDRTPMRIYLNQIEHIPLLTPEEEIELAQKVQNDLSGSREARQKMIRSNLRLVIAIAKRYTNMGLGFSDLVEEGNLGLMRAVEKFDPERGYRFSTYASWWIKQGMIRALSNYGKTIRIPVYMYDIISRWRRVRDGLMQKYNRVPTRKEIAKVMEVPVRKVKEIESITNRPSSLNTPISLDGSAELIDMLEDDVKHKPDNRMGEVLRGERIERLLEILDEREKKVLTLRFGLENQISCTLEEIATKFSITRERVRQIEFVALKKIRAQLVLEGDKLENYVG